MNMQAVLVRATVMLLTCFGVSVAMTAARNPALAANPHAAVVTSTHAAAATASREPAVVLPTISVRPSAAEIAAAMNGETTEFDDVPDFVHANNDRPLFNTAVSLRSLRLDMPYYSFGKALPRVSKE
jgi:hypothetical protein